MEIFYTIVGIVIFLIIVGLYSSNNDNDDDDFDMYDPSKPEYWTLGPGSDD